MLYRWYSFLMKQSMNDHRVQVNMPEYVYEFLRRQAFMTKSSMSDVIRNTLIAKIPKKKTKKTSTRNQWKKFIESAGFMSGARDDSVTHDQWAHQTATFHEK